MLGFLEARQRMLEAVEPLEPEPIPLDALLGRVLAEDLIVHEPLPPFTASAMDGYAVLSTELEGDPPWDLPVSGESRAGGTLEARRPGTAVRIFTGAPLPAGADAVVIQEDVERKGDRVRLSTRPRSGQHLRAAGEDLEAGATALSRGTRLGPFQLGLVAALDRAEVLVARRPRLWLGPSGDELRPPGSPPRPSSIPESNSWVIAALARAAGAEVELGPRIPDSTTEATAILKQPMARVHLMITVGGASVGDHDVVRAALTAAGVTLDFEKVAIKPGKPTSFGRKGRTLVLSLPGNPVSAQVTFVLFGMPLIRALQGDRAPCPPTLKVTLSQGLSQKPGRLGFLRARLEGNVAHIAENQASGATPSLAHADALVLVPADVSECPAGTELEAIRLSDA